MDIRVKLEGSEELARKLQRFGDAERKIVRREVVRSSVAVQTGAKRRVKVDRSTLRQSITYRLISAGLESEIGSNQRHAAVVEFGRRAGAPMPPLEPIRRWALRHGLPEEAAFPIARAIATRGIPPAPYLFPAFEQERKKFVRRVAAGIMEAGREASR